jgi:hypothetical protein
MALFLLAAHGLASPAPAIANRVSLTESLWYEAKTISGSSGSSTWSESREAYRTKVTITLEMNLNGERIGRDATFSLRAGDFEFEAPLSSDPRYKPGRTSANLVGTHDPDERGNRLIFARANLQWSKTRLTAKISATGPNTPSALALSFYGGKVGGFESLSKLSASFGSTATDFDLLVKGKITRTQAASGNVSSEVTVVDLKGATRA